ncbi:MAG: DJ-1/PfpI family protein [Oscillospiraceae bacterium]|nr:DJ-1/PfpI family protein [Oscillospiraceae bacterium]
MIYVFLAEGFEEIEALTPVDCLRRAGKTVQTVGIGGSVIRGSHGIPVTADITEDGVVLDDSLEMIVLPGGMPGTRNLQKNETVRSAVNYCAEQGIFIAAICAAPSILGEMGLLSGKQATCYPGFEPELKGCDAKAVPVCQDGTIITGRGPGAAMDFSLKLVGTFLGDDAADTLAGQMVYRV